MIEIRHPGTLKLNSWELEIYARTANDRYDNETIKLVLDQFKLPVRTTETFDVIYGPNHPIMTYPGRVGPFTMPITVTNFFERRIWEFLITWHEQSISLAGWLDSLRNGHILGYDIQRNVRYKADCFNMWCPFIDFGEFQRNTERHHISANIFIYDIIHDFEFDKYDFTEQEQDAQF